MRFPAGRRSAVLLLGVAVAVAVLGPPTASPAAGARTTQSGTAFYAPPAPLPKRAPGRLIRAERIRAPVGARAWRVLYHSRALDGRDVAVSGIVVAPRGPVPPGGRPVVSWAHGTTGLSDRCAPSRSPAAATALEWAPELLARGYVVAATDYEGLGTPGPHPYLVGESEGRSVLDVARVAGDLAAAGAGTTVVVAGHSQGGQAALFAGELAPRYAPELRVRGVAALAPTTEMATLFGGVAAPPDVAGFLAMQMEGVRAAFPAADVDAVLTPGADAAVRALDRTACVLATLAGFRDQGIAVFRADPNSVPSVRDALRRSTPGYARTKIPVAVFQGARDPLVLAAATAVYVARACARGDRIASTVYADADHGTVLAAASADLLRWLDDRIAGDPAPTTC
jgi:alpha-beta hydrolase superfamily lysophospholipase